MIDDQDRLHDIVGLPRNRLDRPASVYVCPVNNKLARVENVIVRHLPVLHFPVRQFQHTYRWPITTNRTGTY